MRPLLENVTAVQVGIAVVCAVALGLFAAGPPGRHLQIDPALVDGAGGAAGEPRPTAQSAAAAAAGRSPVEFKTANGAAQAFALLDQAGFDLGTAKGVAKVPRVFFTSLPADLADLESVEARKTVFLQVLLPLVLKHNETIAAQRGRLLELGARRDSADDLDADERGWLAALAREYRTTPGDIHALIRRVDIVPPSLAVAQAILESGWGSSRFALEGNALFGEHTSDESVAGMVPAARPDGRRFKVRAFPGLLDAIKGYSHNLNTGRAYAGFREARRRMRGEGRIPDGLALAETLTPYSELGADYVRAVRNLIVRNALIMFDGARLDPGDETKIILPRAGA
ncbi:MAG: glucosaminidase domain-containing protein [Alphaproteobacteria bacterium]